MPENDTITAFWQTAGVGTTEFTTTLRPMDWSSQQLNQYIDVLRQRAAEQAANPPAMTLPDPDPQPMWRIEDDLGNPVADEPEPLMATERPATPRPPRPPFRAWDLEIRSRYADGGVKVKPMDDPNDKEQFYNKKITQLFSLGPSRRQKGLIGLEIEAEGRQLFNTPFQYWTCHTDNSLREVDGHPPIEYTLKVPLSLEETETALHYLASKMKDTGSVLAMSNRTSVHVHINCQGATLRQLYTFLCLYFIFEEVLIDWASPERAGNLFCLRAKDSGGFIEMLEYPLKTGGGFAVWHQDSRYSACNVTAIPKFGSLEFRALRGTFDIDLIMKWIKLLLHIKETAKGFDNPIEIVESFHHFGAIPFFQNVFQDKETQSMLANAAGKDLSVKLWDGLRLMRDVAHCCEWRKPLPKKAKETEPEISEEVHQDDLADEPFESVDAPQRTESFAPRAMNVAVGDIIPSDMGDLHVRALYNGGSLQSHAYIVRYFYNYYSGRNQVGSNDLRKYIPPNSTMLYATADNIRSGAWVLFCMKQGDWS